MKANVKKIAEGLRNFYKDNYPRRHGVEVSRVVDITSGWETELYAYTLEYEEEGIYNRDSLVARLHSGRYADVKVEREFELMGKLARAEYPVPQVYDIDPYGIYLMKPFFTMEMIDGNSMMESFIDKPRNSLGPNIEAFSMLFSNLHAIDVRLIFPDLDFNDTHEYLGYVIKKRRSEIEGGALDWLMPVLDWLEDHSSTVSLGRLSVLHRDFHPGNIMVRSDGWHVVIDWGAATAGDYREDLLWTILLANAFWDEAFGEILLNYYQQASGMDIHDIPFWEVIGIFRRIRDLAVSITSGPEEIGMRSGALDQMRASSEHYHKIHRFLLERTGLYLKEFDELLGDL